MTDAERFYAAGPPRGRERMSLAWLFFVSPKTLAWRGVDHRAGRDRLTRPNGKFAKIPKV